MVDIIVDSSLFIEEIRHGCDEYRELKGLYREGKNKLYIPMVVIAELWAGKSMDNKKEVSIVEHIISIFDRVDVDEKVARLTGEIVRDNKIGVVDAIIAATCINHEAQLATLNTKHFVGIKGLKLYK